MFGGTRIPGTALPQSDQKLWDAEVKGRRAWTREHAAHHVGARIGVREILVGFAVLTAACVVLWIVFM